jgi:hypothetical protein
MILKTIAILALTGIAAVLAYAATRPDTFSVQRSVQIRADAQRIHPLINDMRQMNAWNPFTRDDPKMKGAYRGPAAGPGAAFDFSGGKGGDGSIEITESGPQLVAMKLDMRKPMEAHNTVRFTLAPRGTTTEVTWSMQGPVPYFAKVLHLFINMDSMVGGAFEAGLAELKTRAERA